MNIVIYGLIGITELTIISSFIYFLFSRFKASFSVPYTRLSKSFSTTPEADKVQIRQKWI